MMGLVLLALCAAVGRAAQIKIILDKIISPKQAQGKGYQFAYVEVSDQITVADLIEKANYDGQVYYDDWDHHRTWSKTVWGSDGGDFLKDAYGYSVNGPYNNMYSKAFYGGRQLRATSTLASNGIKEMSTVLLMKEKETGNQIRASEMVYLRIKFNGKSWFHYFYAREDTWNVANAISHRYGISINDFELTSKVMGTRQFDPNALDDFMTLWHIKTTSGDNPVEVAITRTSSCQCLSSGEYAAPAAKAMTKRLVQGQYGLSCKAHDQGTKVCKGKNIKKGNRECWCPRKWCYVRNGCGSPSTKFPGLSFSYDTCDNNDDVDCFASDTEGTEGAQLDDFDIWNFPKVTGYLRQLAAVLVDAFPGLKGKFETD